MMTIHIYITINDSHSVLPGLEFFSPAVTAGDIDLDSTVSSESPCLSSL